MLFTACVAFVAMPAFAQAPDKTVALAPETAAAAWPADLPKGELKGNWDWRGFGNSMTNRWSLTIETYDPATGAVGGKLTFYGEKCNARNVPATGSYKDGVLTIKGNMGFQCHNDPFVLQKGPPGRLQGTWANNTKYYLD